MENKPKNQTNFFGEIKGNIHTGKGDIHSHIEHTANNEESMLKKENINVLIVLIILDIAAIIIASIWAYTSKWDFEPLITVLGLVGGLIALLIVKSKK